MIPSHTHIKTIENRTTQNPRFYSRSHSLWATNERDRLYIQVHWYSFFSEIFQMLNKLNYMWMILRSFLVGIYFHERTISKKTNTLEFFSELNILNWLHSISFHFRWVWGKWMHDGMLQVWNVWWKVYRYTRMRMHWSRTNAGFHSITMIST